MKLFGILAPRRKKHHFCTVSTDNHDYTNLIKEIPKEQFVPHLIWVCGCIIFKFQGQFWYLATIEDLATRQVIAAQVGKFHDSALIISVIKQAILVTEHTPTYFHTRPGNRIYGKNSYRLFELRSLSKIKRANCENSAFHQTHSFLTSLRVLTLVKRQDTAERNAGLPRHLHATR